MTTAPRPAGRTGRYIVTGLPAFADWAHAKPFVMERPDQFRPGPPPALTSPQWAADYNEIKSLGGKVSSAGTKEQAEVAQFWTLTGAPSCNPLLRGLAARGQRTPLQNISPRPSLSRRAGSWAGAGQGSGG